MGGLLQSELFRLQRRAMPRILLGIMATFIVLLYLAFFSIVQTVRNDPANAPDAAPLEELVRVENVREFGLGLVYQVGGVMVVILAASAIGTEYGWGTIRTILSRTPARSAFLLAKLSVLVLFAVVVVAVGYLVAVGASATVSALLGIGGGLGDGFATASLAAMGRTVYVMLPFLALAFLVSTWGRSTAAGIGVALAVLFLEGLITSLIANAGGPFENLPRFLLNANVQGVLAANGTAAQQASGATPDLPGAGQGAAVLAAYTAAFVALTLWRFRTRDITVGSGG